MAKFKKEYGKFGSYPGIRDQSEKYTYKTPGNKGIFPRELGNKQKFKREEGNMYLPKRPSAKKEQRHATNQKPNMYINIYNKNKQYFDSQNKSSSG